MKNRNRSVVLTVLLGTGLATSLATSACRSAPGVAPLRAATATPAATTTITVTSTTAISSTLSPGDQLACMPVQGEPATIATAKLIIEYNATDQDLGVHGAFDDVGWSELCVYDPNGAQVLAVRPQAQLNGLTMAGIFFESREPPIAEFSFQDIKTKFPEGQYQVRAMSFDGKALTGSALFSHAVPATPTVTFPLEGAMVPITNLVIQWQDVTETVDGGPVTITGYEVIITKLDHTDPHGFSRPIFDVNLPADRNSLAVPVEFLEPGTEYELEVLALEESGNQTITVSSFKTE